jgi:uncharacterized membrane protein YfcA
MCMQGGGKVDALTLAGLGAAAAAAGAVNAVAGGGTLISFPSLLAAGFPAKVANVTSTVAIWPGTVGGSLAYRRELASRKQRLVRLAVPAVLGAIAGSLLLLATSQRLFDAVVPFLVLFASLLLAANSRLSALAARRGMGAREEGHLPLPLHVSIFAAGIYGGYFGAGLGIITLAAISIFAPDDMQHANAVKGMLALLVNFAAVVIFVASGLVEWAPALVMAVCAIGGGYAGVSLARRLNARVLRNLIVVWGLTTSVWLFLR